MKVKIHLKKANLPDNPQYTTNHAKTQSLKIYCQIYVSVQKHIYVNSGLRLTMKIPPPYEPPLLQQALHTVKQKQLYFTHSKYI